MRSDGKIYSLFTEINNYCKNMNHCSLKDSIRQILNKFLNYNMIFGKGGSWNKCCSIRAQIFQVAFSCWGEQKIMWTNRKTNLFQAHFGKWTLFFWNSQSWHLTRAWKVRAMSERWRIEVIFIFWRQFLKFLAMCWSTIIQKSRMISSDWRELWEKL